MDAWGYLIGQFEPRTTASLPRRRSDDTLAIKRLQNLQIALWPSEDALRLPKAELGRMFPTFPNATATNLTNGGPSSLPPYLERLLELRRVARSLLGTPAHHHLTGIGAWTAWDSFFAYDPFTNAVSVWPGALSEPFFYSRGNTAINYGGLASAFAWQLVTAIDIDNVRFHPQYGSFPTVCTSAGHHFLDHF